VTARQGSPAQLLQPGGRTRLGAALIPRQRFRGPATDSPDAAVASKVGTTVPAGLHFPDRLLQRLVDVFGIHVQVTGGLPLRPGDGFLDRVLDLVLPDHDERGLAWVDKVPELLRPCVTCPWRGAR